MLPPLNAHRLGREPGPDSSRAALQATLAGPVDGLETDACLTADGRLVLLHDPWLSTATTLWGWAHQTVWSDLRHARLRDRDAAPTNETPMLLDELLDQAPRDLPVQVEVKAYSNPAGATARGGQPAARSTARIRRWPSISSWSTTSTSSRPTRRPRRRRASGEKPQ
jgi:glycerophosphoryl diester phosphodiesterase